MENATYNEKNFKFVLILTSVWQTRILKHLLYSICSERLRKNWTFYVDKWRYEKDLNETNRDEIYHVCDKKYTEWN